VAEWYRQIYGLEAVHVPYKGVPQAVADLMAGRIDFMFADASLGISTARSGKARALATTTPKRISSAPDLPTMIESGVDKFVADGWLALFFPARTPVDIARRLADASNAVITTDQAREFLRKANAEPLPGSPEALAKSVIEENAKWGAIVRKAGIEPE
jgi:tripartite-type tricarboxylate transporter receptor subunit TctC